MMDESWLLLGPKDFNSGFQGVNYIATEKFPISSHLPSYSSGTWSKLLFAAKETEAQAFPKCYDRFRGYRYSASAALTLPANLDLSLVYTLTYAFAPLFRLPFTFCAHVLTKFHTENGADSSTPELQH